MPNSETIGHLGEPNTLLELLATRLFFLVYSAEDVKKRLSVPEIKDLCEEILVTSLDDYPPKIGPKNLVVRLHRIREDNLPKIIAKLRAEGIIPVETEERGILDNAGTEFYSIVVYAGPQWWDWLKKMGMDAIGR